MTQTRNLAATISDITSHIDPGTTVNIVQASHNFGLIERAYDTDDLFDPHHEKTQWQRFQFHVKELNTHAPPGVQFKVLYRWSCLSITPESILTAISWTPWTGLS